MNENVQHGVTLKLGETNVVYDTVIMSVPCARFGLYKAHGMLPVFVAPAEYEFRLRHFFSGYT